MQRVCVFCGSRSGVRGDYAAAAQSLGRLLASKHIGLVTGGGHIGLMGVIADAVLAAGGEVVGVIPRGLADRELAHTRLTQLHIVPSMHERKALMADLSNGFIALPGGYGTADELFEILTWAQIGLHSWPVGLLNVSGFFDPLFVWLDHAMKEGFLKPAHRRLLLTATDPTDLLDVMLAYRPEAPSAKWAESPER